MDKSTSTAERTPEAAAPTDASAGSTTAAAAEETASAAAVNGFPVPQPSQAKAPVEAAVPPSTSSAPPAPVEARPLGAPGTVVRPGPDPHDELLAVMKAADRPAVIVLRNESDVPRVYELARGLKNTFVTRVNPRQTVRALWRRL